MIEVISIKFKNRGKCYFFSPNGLDIKSGDKVIVETSKGLEIADCHYGNHMVEDTAVVQPLRSVIRVATEDDLRVAQLNKKREKEAFEICQKKIAEHGLDMKLVDVECNFEGSKTMFFFTSDGRVDFRELVKDLAGIFRNRIELRQIGVRDEAKMIGGIGPCGRPYCCNQFLDEFQPVSTKMAKVQNLSLNPSKISGSCGRLMCCLRYEQDAYEELIKSVPKQGAFVETKDGYGTAVQVNLLRQTVKVKLDEGGDDNLRLFKVNELAAVPGGRPKDGETPEHVLHYIPPADTEEEEEKEDEWFVPEAVISESEPVQEETEPDNNAKKPNRRRNNKPNRPQKPKAEALAAGKQEVQKNSRDNKQDSSKNGKDNKPVRKKPQQHRGDQKARKRENGEKPEQKKHQGGRGKATVKPVKVENKAQLKDGEDASKSGAPKKKPNRRGYYHTKPIANKGGGENKQ